MVRMLLSSLTPCLCSIKEVEVLGFHCVFVSPSFFFWGGGSYFGSGRPGPHCIAQASHDIAQASHDLKSAFLLQPPKHWMIGTHHCTQPGSPC